MLTWLNKQGVKSSKGFVFQRINRYFYYYIEGDKKMKVEVEPLRSSPNCYYEHIGKSSTSQWLSPHEREIIPDEEGARIISNITEALSFMGIKHEFVG